MTSLVCAIALMQKFEPTKLQIDYVSRGGFSATYDGVPVFRGSFFQIYEGNWERGLYSSNWNDQTVRKEPNGDILVEFATRGERIKGSQRYRRTAEGIEVEYRFGWSGDRPVNLENTVGIAWAPLFENGAVFLDEKEARSPKVRITPGNDPGPRLFGAEARSVRFVGPFMDVAIDCSRADTTVLDGRGYQQDWADDDELFWIGADRIPIAPRDEIIYTAKIAFMPKSRWAVKSSLWQPKETGQSGLAKPKSVEISIPVKSKVTGSGQLKLVSAKRGPISIRGIGLFAPAKPATIATGVADLGLPAEGFEIEIDASKVRVTGQDAKGLAYGLASLGSLATGTDSDWSLPALKIRDYPSLKFRGVHLFVGPKSPEWHKAFAQRVLLPMRFNHVVLQCEQTAWNAIPGTRTAITTSREDLKRIFDQYRALGIEPIPLIQSFGHMEWLFANKKNLALAFNPAVPYAIDPRKPEAQAKIAEIWEEAIALLKPKMLHFGLDEVDMRGFEKNPALTTELWRKQIPFLAKIAENHGLPMMLWGDKGLAPGEAPDAALGDDKANAAARRASIPKGAIITDWHYINDPRPEIYSSLKLWQNAGMVPIAATWNRHGNIVGFTHAAINTGSLGVLQTTWAGYEAGEEAMLRSAPQFSSMILTGYYAWSGDKTLPGALPFDVEKVLTDWYFGSFVPSVKRTQSYGEGATISIGAYSIPVERSIRLASVLDPGTSENPTEVTWNLPIAADRFAFAARTQVAGKAGETVATALLTFQDGTSLSIPIRYGYEVRAITDSRATWRSPRNGSWSAIEVGNDLVKPAKKIKAITIRTVSKVAGLELGGAVILGG